LSRLRFASRGGMIGGMPTYFDSVFTGFLDACVAIFVVAFGGAFLFWGVFMGKLIATGFHERPSRKRILMDSLPIAIAISTVFGAWSFWLIQDPGESRDEAVYNAASTFFCVLIPLLMGFVWADYALRQPASAATPSE
jgi:hypothetical protein